MEPPRLWPRTGSERLLAMLAVLVAWRDRRGPAQAQMDGRRRRHGNRPAEIPLPI